jgi:hypothetical protein
MTQKKGFSEQKAKRNYIFPDTRAYPAAGESNIKVLTFRRF